MESLPVNTPAVLHGLHNNARRLVNVIPAFSKPATNYPYQ